MVKVTDLLMDYEKSQCGIGSMPQLGWILESDRKNVFQDAYRIQLGEDASFERLLHDSGWVEARESAHVFLPEMPLKSMTRYYVRVQVRAG